MAFKNDYTLGKGKFYFRRFLPGTETPEPGGFRRVGNVPTATVSQTREKLDHTSSEGGINVKDDSVTTSQDSAIAFTTDNVSMDNLAMWFNSTVSDVIEAGGAVVAEPIPDVVLGTFYQLGETPTTPQGARGISAVAVKKGATVFDVNDDYKVDLATGMLEIIDGGAIVAGDDITVDYTVPAGTRRVILGDNDTLEGQFKFIADNPKGTNKDTFWPRVQLSPDGDYALIGTDWQTVGFAVDVLQASDGSPRSITEQR